MAQNINRLTNRHLAMMELYLQGKTPDEIALATGGNAVVVRAVCRQPLFQDAVAKRRRSESRTQGDADASAAAKAQVVFDRNAEGAAEKHVEFLHHEDARVAQASANAILDRVYAKGGQGQGRAPVTVINAEQLQVLNLALSEDRLEEDFAEVG